MDKRSDTGQSKCSVVVRRTYDATPEELFDAWLTPGLIEKWWGPEAYVTKVAKFELREGGEFRFEMIWPKGTLGAMAGTFIEINKPSRLVLEMSEHCTCNLPEGEEQQLATALVTADFVSKGSTTELVVTHDGLSTPHICEQFDEGWCTSLERLEGLR